MQSANELAREVAKSVSDAIHTPIVLDIYGSAVDMIRARDRETVERCREMVRTTPIYIPGDGKREPLNEGFDAILRDLG